MPQLPPRPLQKAKIQDPRPTLQKLSELRATFSPSHHGELRRCNRSRNSRLQEQGAKQTESLFALRLSRTCASQRASPVKQREPGCAVT